LHETGNANVVVSRDPAANLDRLYPISYGSSHIQAVSFTDDGVDASTILTYGQATDPSSPFSSDQTRIFGQEQWVGFPFTARQIRKDAQRRYVVTDRRAR
jgi:acyl-homoserine-lactone acylase